MKILIAEDDPVSRRRLEALLGKLGYDVVVAEDGTRAWEMLQADGAPRLALLDWMMPGKDGVEVCREARKRGAHPYIYILLLTARDDKQDVIEGLESGADDYLTKPFHPLELQARLQVGKRILDLEDNLVSAREGLQFRATHDSLTGLWNRGAILDSLAREIERGRREQKSLGIVLADIDHFKAINDTYGHLIGDIVLREIARRLTGAVRSYDAVGRYGGEEFLIVLSGCDDAVTRDRAEQLRASIGSYAIETAEGVFPATLSIGAVSSSGGREINADVLLRAADAGLYRAKNGGRNRVEMASLGEIPVLSRKASGDRVALELSER